MKKLQHQIMVAMIGVLNFGIVGHSVISTISYAASSINPHGFSVNVNSGVIPLAVSFSRIAAESGASCIWNFGDGTVESGNNPVHLYTAAGKYNVMLTVTETDGAIKKLQWEKCIIALPHVYPVAGTNVVKYYDAAGQISAPAKGDPYFGQNASCPGTASSYTDNGDGTITDNITGLMWIRERGSKVTWDAASAGAAENRTGGYSDWRMPSVKELYSLIQFSGVNGRSNMSTEGYTPFIDTRFFGFVYGSGRGSERVIDCQDWSSTAYVSTTMNNDAAIFGVNFADGRIKGYPKYKPRSRQTIGHTLFVRYVRSNPGYGKNVFHDNADGTVTDSATRLMWSKEDCRKGLNWPEALAWVQTQNAENYLGRNDWRLPDAKELESIVDYTRSPEKTGSPAIDVRFLNTSSITNEAGQADYPYFWTSTVLLDGGPEPSGIYICFGRAMGCRNGSWIDVHGAGSQKSDIMTGDPGKFPKGRGPQGDAVRIYNYVRLVRNI